MNELLKGLIGAELTLLGVPNQAWSQVDARALDPVWLPTGADGERAVQQGVSIKEEASSQVQFNTDHYRIAAG
ncbi:hypothetical protein [Bordetella flabilis]|uniref:Uncharacterized protein n=1 Tax=Bordetella flabilis TaxID=463014 RepID=A0A193G9G0_9BORD|nr:hypothetical protein [Bordetella flabilis]ANN76622.1 hypothetical protein BAU07_05355 [Bordetella flabilis]